MDKIPTFEMVINPDETSDVEVSFVALVDKPAIERNFLAFNKQLLFALDEEKRIISGPAMVADSLIYRKDEQGEYNVFFSAETIKQIALKFFKKDYHKNLNLFHDASLSLEGVTIFESFVSDASRGVLPMAGFKDLPDGTWFISAKVENDEVWNKIKSGEVKGFSVEGIFSYVKKVQNATGSGNSHLYKSDFMGNVIDMLKDLKQTFLGNPQAPVASAPVPAQDLNTDYALVDGTPVSIDKLEVGGVVMVAGAPAPAGELELADGTKVSVGEGGVIAAVAAAAMAAPATDYSEQFANYDQKFADYESKFTAYEERFTNQEKAISNANATIVQLVSIVEELAKAPTADPIGTNNNSFSSQKIEGATEKRKALAASLMALKNKNK